MDNSNDSIDKKLSTKDIHKPNENNDNSFDSSISINETCGLTN